MKFHLILLANIFLFVSVLFSCKEENPVKPSHPATSYELMADEPGVSNVTIHLRLTQEGVEAPETLLLRRDSTVVFRIPLPFRSSSVSLDTAYTDPNLFPKHAYQYKAIVLTNTIPTDSSAPLAITSMDTTSHCFQWEYYELGVGLGNSLSGAAIVNDTCIWVVGGLYRADSLGRLETSPCGAAIWDGYKWTFQQLRAWGITHTVTLTPQGIYAFGPGDIWLANSGVFRWQSLPDTITPYWINTFPGNPNPILLPGQNAVCLWGSSDIDLFAGAWNGGLAHFDGLRWIRIETNTTLDIADIFGAVNPKTGQLEILATAANPSQTYDYLLLSLNGTAVIPLSTKGVTSTVSSVWFVPCRAYYAVGNGIFTRTSPPDDTSHPWIANGATFLSLHYKQSVRGNDINDVAILCDNGDILHFNGWNWKKFSPPASGVGQGIYRNMAMKGNTIVAVGSDGAQGIVAIGRR